MKNKRKQPNTDLHYSISMTKSIFRMIGCVALGHSLFFKAGVFLFIAEVLGMVEEMV